jgi:hypothetical protein
MDSEVIETSYENVQQYSEDCNCWRSSSLENKYLRSFKITMSWQRETNLNNRMNEAFEHLKSFCTNKSNNREKF